MNITITITNPTVNVLAALAGAHAADNAKMMESLDKASTALDALLDEIAAALAFPATFGGNWDALADSLGDLSWLPAPGYVLLLDHSTGLRESAPDDFAILLEILDEAARTHARAGVPFWAVLPTASSAT